MQKYRVELSSPAERVYRRIREAATECIELGDASSAKAITLKAVDDLIDKTIPHSPFETGRELSPPLARIFWVSRERLHIFYTASPKPRTIAILSIWDTPKNEASRQHADAILKQMVLSGQLDDLLLQYGLRAVSNVPRSRPFIAN
jgi:hypothetical protein